MDILMPQLGETVEEGTVAAWLKKPGDRVAKDEILCEIETDKVATEVPATADGTLKEISVEEGETVKVGTVLGVLEADGGKPEQEKAGKAGSGGGDGEDEAADSGKSGGGLAQVVMPQLGETVQEGTVAAWHKEAGERVAVNDILCEIETDKVATEVPALVSGTLKEIKVKAEETVKVGTVLALIEADEGEDVEKQSAAAQEAEPPPQEEATAERGEKSGSARRGDENAAKLTPLVRRLIQQYEIDPAEISGTGIGGRISKDDVLAHVEKADKNKSARTPTGAPYEGKLSPVVRRMLAEHEIDPQRITGTGKEGRIKKTDVLAYLSESRSAKGAPAGLEEKTVPLSKLRKSIAKHMVESKATSAHVLQAVEVDYHNVERARTAVKESWNESEGFSLTYLPFTAFAACLAIRDFPGINASIDGENLLLHGRVNLGIAVDLNFEGLVAPVVKDAHEQSVAELARAIHDLAGKARANKLSPDDMTEGTYTISNSGVFGTMITAPIINQPQLAIMSTDGVSKKPVVIEGEDSESIAIRPVGIIAQSFDHRAIDGAYSAAFLKRVKEIIEQTDWRAELD